MDRYYKTSRSSATGLKIQALLSKADEFNKQVEVLRKKYGFGKVWTSSSAYWDVYAVEFKDQPDIANWEKRDDVPDGYYPRATAKNMDIFYDFTNLNLNAIGRGQFDSIIGNEGFSNQAGFDFSIPDIYVFIIESDWECKIPKDCEEISNIECNKLISK